MRKFFAVLFSLLLVFPIILGAQATVSVITWVLDRNFYIDTLNQPEVYMTLTSGPMIDQMIHQQLRLPVDTDTSELESVLQSILTPAFLNKQVSAFINGLFDFLQGKTEEFSPAIDVTPLKTALADEKQDEFLTALLAAMPVCQPGQIPGFGGETESACKPAGIPDELIIEQALKPALPTVLTQMPDEIPMEGEIARIGENMRWRAFIPGMAVPASIILSMLVLIFIAIVIWYLTALIADASWRIRLQWLGWTLMIPSLLIFLLGLASQSGIPAYWINFGLERASLTATPFGPQLADTLKVVANSALPRVASAFQMVGAICGAIALTFIFWGIATPRKKTEEIS